MKILSLFRDTLSIFYPDLCVACEDLLVRGEETICTRCRISLPYTNYHNDPDNPVAKQFWGKVKLEAATSLFHFHKGEKVQQMIHRLKYDHRKDVGISMGKLSGLLIKKASVFSTVDVVIPIPLHRKKERSRGYNQAACFSEGLANTMEILHLPRGMKRVKHTSTQTKKSRFVRFQNVEEVFKITDHEILKGKHVLLVDDVITTGSTLSACAQVLLDAGNIKVSVASIAYAGL